MNAFITSQVMEETGYIKAASFLFYSCQISAHIRITPTLLPSAGGLVSRERLLANRRLGAQEISALIVMLLLLLLLMLLLPLLRHL